MNKIIPFEKELVFQNNIDEITSIALENTLSINNNLINGNFIVSGDYKINDASLSVEPFNEVIPVEIHIDDKYMTNKAIVDIDDFYYEIINNNILKVCIDVRINKLEEKESIEMDRNIIKDVKDKIEIIQDKVSDSVDLVTEQIKETIDNTKETIEDAKENVKEKINSLFSNIGSSDNYISYNIYIIRDGDTVETILDKYNTTEDNLRLYNDLTDLKIGDKIVIPN